MAVAPAPTCAAHQAGAAHTDEASACARRAADLLSARQSFRLGFGASRRRDATCASGSTNCASEQQRVCRRRARGARCSLLERKERIAFSRPRKQEAPKGLVLQPEQLGELTELLCRNVSVRPS